ncbi:MAG: fibronectin type III domain-containing protein [Candidatus Sumerlaeaceae bacterium]
MVTRAKFSKQSTFRWAVFIIAFIGMRCTLQAETVRVLMLRDGAPVWIERETMALPGGLVRATTRADSSLAQNLAAALQAQVSPPPQDVKAQGVKNFVPEGAHVAAVEVTDGMCTAALELPPDYLAAGISDEDLELFAEMLAGLATQYPDIRSLVLVTRESDTSPWKPLTVFAKPAPPQLEKPASKSETTSSDSILPKAGQNAAQGQPQPTGALTGASIFLSPGHGWAYNSSLGRWATQRTYTNGLIEDHSNAEACLQYLVRYLWNAGARVYTVRERDMNTNMVIVDNASATYSGTWTLETASGAYGGNHSYAVTVTGSPTATATYTPNIPVAGYYAVYVWYRKSASGTTTADARIRINHTGGTTVWTQDQNVDGYTWKYVGTYYFQAGTNPASGSVVIDNLSSTAGNRVIADAVRFGGGMGDVADNVSGTTSGWPRWEESGRYYAAFMGKSDWASYNTVTAMPSYASWECESWESGRSVYVAWHTNAPNPGTGTETYAYASGGYDTTFDGVPGGLELRNFIHNEIINDIRKGYDSGWTDRGKHTNWYGELNPSYNNKMPAALTEIAFHDTPSDAAKLKDPVFRQIAARAVYQGIVKFFNSYYPGTFPNATLLPEPPTNLRVVRTGPNSVTLSWNAPPYNTGDGLLGDAATGYRVYRSTDGKGFDNGTPVTGTSYTMTGLTPGQVYYFRVSATNAGGESFPTETLAASCYANGPNPILIVNGFDRLDAAMSVQEPDPYSTGILARHYLWKMNSYDYIIAHAKAIKAYGRDFDSCSNEAVRDGQISLSNYATVIWILGRESSVDKTFDSAERTAIQNYLANGGKLFVTGSEIGYELDGLSVAPTFYNNVLRTDYVQDSAGTYDVQGVSGSIFDGLSFSFDNGSLVYDVPSPDVISPINGSQAALKYTNMGTTLLDSLDSVAGWWDPNSSGSTDPGVDPASAFTLASSPVHQGSGAGDLYYVWGTGQFIREYNSNQPQLPANATLSMWVYGDGSGNQVRFCIRDSEPSPGPDLFVSDYFTINFTGWQKLTWQIGVDPTTKWAGGGDGLVTGPYVKFDSIHIKKGASSPASGHLYFDEITYSTGGNAVAAIVYDGGTGGPKLVYFAFPFETITSESARNAVMSNVLNFFNTPLPVSLSEFITE